MSPRTFPYAQMRNAFAWDRPSRYNFVRHGFAPWAERQPDATALFWTDGEGVEIRKSFSELLTDSHRAASLLRAQGVRRGDTVLLLLSRELFWWEIVLGCLQIGAIVSPGTIQLTRKDIAFRLTAANAKAVITNASMAKRAEEAIGDSGWEGICLCIDGVPSLRWVDYAAGRATASPVADIADTSAEEDALCFFTSGTTGYPKQTVHRQDYPLGHKATGAFWLDARPGALIWNLSDTGWAKAAWSSLFAPWLRGAGIFALHTEAFDVEETLRALEVYPVTTLCAPPTVYRMLVREDLGGRSFQALARCVSAGEPLNPEVIELWRTATGMDIHEGYGQSETVLLCGNFEGMEIRPGSMGLPAPGIDLQVIDDNGDVLPPGVEGDVAVNMAPGQAPMGMFSRYRDDADRTKSVFRHDWYLTGDRATRDKDGYFWFVGRSDDVILTSGYRIGPFEVESVLFEHEAVAESAVVASPDPVRGEVIKAFVILAKGFAPSDALKKELQDHVKGATAPYKYPRKIEFVESLPKTISGKIKRKELKEQEWRGQG